MVSIKDKRICLHCPNIVALCLDSYDAKIQNGRLYHQYTDVPIRFGSLIEAVCKMDAFYDDICFPYADTETRSLLTDRETRRRALQKSRKTPELPEYRRKEKIAMVTFDQVSKQRGNDATFIIRVSHRQHSSWQGEVTWVDGGKKEYFRSALELVKMIDGILETEKMKEEPLKER